MQSELNSPDQLGEGLDALNFRTEQTGERGNNKSQDNFLTKRHCDLGRGLTMRIS